MKSRILNVSPRAYLRDLDSVNELPPIVRTGYQNETGYESSTPFDDSTTILNQSQVMLAPYMVTASLAGFLTGTIYVTSSYKDQSSYLFRPVINDLGTPYKESLNESPFSIGSANNAGFPAQIYPGFTSSAESRIAINIDITPAAQFKTTRISRADSLLDAAGEFYDTPKTGFIYFNFKNRQWDNIGLNDPVTGNELNYTSNLTSSVGRIVSGNHEIMVQFCSTPGISYKNGSTADYISGYMTSSDQLKIYGYTHIGYPTSFFEAPYAPRYHATQDQVIKLSNYIKHPIACDRINVKLPVSTRKIQDPSAYDADYSFARDIDNHAFFLYVQRRSNAAVDSIADVSSSIRFLIANRSMQSINLFPFYSSLSSSISTTGFSGDAGEDSKVYHNTQQTAATTAGVRQVSSKDSNFNMTFRPRDYDQFYGSLSRLSAWRTTTSTNDNVMVRNFWRGGQYASGSTQHIQTWSSTSTTQNRMVGFSTGSQNDNNTSILPGRSLVRSTWLTTKTGSLTTDDLTPDDCQLASDYKTYSSEYPYTETPIILYPEDELVIGIDSGVFPNLNRSAPNNAGVDRSISSVTGSLLTLRSEPASVTLFGTLVREDHEILPELNQHLGSSAVSEDIHFNNVVTDQYDALPRISLSSSYVDNIIDRSNGFGYDQVMGTYTHFTDWSPYSSLGSGYEEYAKSYWNGSLQRNIRLTEDNVVYYDTMTAEPANIAAGILSASVYVSGTYSPSFGLNFNFPPNTIRFVYDESAPEELGFAFNNNRPSGPTDNRLLLRSFTYETSTQATKRYRDLSIVYDYPVGMFRTQRATSDDRARFILYYNGFYPLNTNSILTKNYTGAASLRYGYMNPRLIGPSWVFRRDHYGHVRDMLEQSRTGKTHFFDELGKPQVSSAAVIATFVSASSDNIISGSQTQSSNLSTECTSSIPFTDGTGPRNRDASLPTHSATFGVNNLIFGVTGSVRFQ